MKYKLIAFTILIGIACIALGCNGISASRNGKNTNSGLFPIKNGITFSVKEVYNPGPIFNTPTKPFIQLKMQTKGTFGAGTSIISGFEQNETKIELRIHGIKSYHGFTTGVSVPALYISPLDLKPGQYNLNFHYKNKHATYNLIVSDSSIKVSGKNTSFFTSKTHIYWKYPEKSFVYDCFSPKDKQWKCKVFEKMLNDSLDIKAFTFPPYGTIPYQPAKGVFDIVTYYYYPNVGVFKHAGSMLNAYSDTATGPKANTYLRITNWKNVVYWSSDNRK